MNEIPFNDRIVGLKTRLDRIPKKIKAGVGLAATLTSLLSGCTPDQSANKLSTPPTGMENDPKPTNVTEAPAGFVENITNKSNVYELLTAQSTIPIEEASQNQLPTPEPTIRTIDVNVHSKPKSSNLRVVPITPTAKPESYSTESPTPLPVGETRNITVQSGYEIGGSTQSESQAPKAKVIPVTPSPESQQGQPIKPTPIPTTSQETTGETRVITVQSGSVSQAETDSPPIPINPENQTSNTPNSSEKSKWTETKWDPNQTIPLSEWWNDMVSGGEINIKSTAQQYAGDKIRDILNGLDLVPNPQDYHQFGRFFAGSCFNQLQELIARGQGYIEISQEAFEQVPGGQACDIYANHD